MGKLSLSVGPLSSSLNFDNAKGANVLNAYASAYGLDVVGQFVGSNFRPALDENGDTSPASNQQKLDYIVQHLKFHMIAAAKGQARRDAVEAAREAVEGSGDYDA